MYAREASCPHCGRGVQVLGHYIDDDGGERRFKLLTEDRRTILFNWENGRLGRHICKRPECGR